MLKTATQLKPAPVELLSLLPELQGDVYTGTISYGIYLLEKIPFDAAKAFHLDRHPFVAFPITTAATYALASLSWLILEKPFLRLKRFFEAKKAVQSPMVEEMVGATQS